MSKFGSMLSVELQKIFKAKFVYIMLIVVFLLCLVMVGTYEIMNTFDLNLDLNNDIYSSPQEALDDINTTIKVAEESGYKDSYHTNVLGQLKRRQQYYAYMVDNNLGFNDVEAYATSSMNSNYIDFARLISQIALGAAVLIIIVIASRNLAGEISSGSIKMTLIRPVSRNAVIASKMTAAFITGFSVYILFNLLGAIYGMARFGLSAKDLILVTEWSATRVSAMGVYSIEQLANIFTLFAYLLLSYATGVSLKSKGSALALPLIVYLLGSTVGSLLQFVFIGYAEFSFNLGFMSALQVNVHLFKGISVYSMLAVSIAYVVLLGVIIQRKFRKFTV